MLRRTMISGLTFGLPVATTAALPEPAQRLLRQRLLAEEFEEYRAAEAESDIIEVADALADIAYIVSRGLP